MSLSEHLKQLAAESLEKDAFQPMPGGTPMDEMSPEQAQQMGIDPAEMGMEQVPLVGELPADQFAELMQGIVMESIQQSMPQFQQMMMSMQAQGGGGGGSKGGGQGDVAGKLDQVIALLGGVLPSNGMPPGAGQVPPGGAGVPPVAPEGAPPGGGMPPPGMQVQASAEPKTLSELIASRLAGLRSE